MAIRYPLEPLLQLGQMILKPRKFKDLETSLGYAFKKPDLLERALTHSSVRGNRNKRADNERLEFIGDRVLGLAVAEALHQANPAASEGEMARRYNALVRGEACAAVARQLGLGPHLIMASSEIDNGGREKENILADAMEAVLGAVFLDGGFLKARQVILTAWNLSGDTTVAAATTEADPKSALQEWAQARGLALPGYIALERTGPDHAPQFRTQVQVEGFPPCEGCGPSKRAAEQTAASAMLAQVTSGVTAGKPASGKKTQTKGERRG